MISCLLDRRFNQLSHGAEVSKVVQNIDRPIMIPCSIQCYKLEKEAPNVGLEPTTLRLRVSCSTD